MARKIAWEWDEGGGKIAWAPSGRDYVLAERYGGYGPPRRGAPVSVFHERLVGEHGRIVRGLAEVCTYAEWRARSAGAWLARLRR